MPTVNFFSTNNDQKNVVLSYADELKEYFAKTLSCGDIELITNEISLRIMDTVKVGMIADLELEITAHAFDERVQKQDDICHEVRKYIMTLTPDTDVRVWLLLPQLGHSWQ